MISFVCWPAVSIKRSNETARAWARLGWKVAIAIDASIPEMAVRPDTVVSHVPPLRVKEWKGYYNTINFLAKALCNSFSADIVVCASDSILPSPEQKSFLVGGAFAQHFPNGFGVCQALGEVWKPEKRGSSGRDYMPGRLMHATPDSSERCESPILGRAWILEANKGKGPYSDKYAQYWADVELHDVASRMGVLWKNKAILHRQEHWSKPGGPPMEPYQVKNFDRWYEKDYAMYRTRRQKEFPDSERGIGKPSNGLHLPSQKLWTP